MAQHAVESEACTMVDDKCKDQEPDERNEEFERFEDTLDLDELRRTWEREKKRAL
jgi:hypothetical protein